MGVKGFPPLYRALSAESAFSPIYGQLDVKVCDEQADGTFLHFVT